MRKPVPVIKPIKVEKKVFNEFIGYKTGESVFSVGDKFFTDGQNVIIGDKGTFEPRYGHIILGDYQGKTTKVLGLFQFHNSSETIEHLKVYDTGVYRLVGNNWVALTGATMTTGKVADGCYFPFNNKYYILNDTNSVVKYTSDTSADQTDTDFKKGNAIVSFKNRLLVGTGNQVWYTSNGADTFTATSYFFIDGQVTSLEVISDDVVLVFSKRKLYRLQNFTFDGAVSGPEAVVDLGVTYGAIIDKSVVNANGMVYFLGQDENMKVQVYRTNGWAKPEPIGDDIAPDLNALSTSQLTSSAAGFDGRYIRFSVTLSGESANSMEYLYDTITNTWLPPQTGGFSCYSSYEVSGRTSLIAGSVSDSNVYVLNDVDGYDEAYDQTNLGTGDADVAITASTSTRIAQGFKLSADSAETMTVVGVVFRAKKTSGTTTELTARIETDSSGKPSGTLADTDATVAITAFSDAGYVYKYAKFTGVVMLSGSTQYHLVIKHTTEATGNSVYSVNVDESTPAYTDGALSTYASSTWTAVAGSDMDFAIVTKSAIDAYAVWGSFLSVPDQYKKITKIFTELAADGEYNIQFGIKDLTTNNFTDININLNGVGETWGGGALWGDGSTYGIQNFVMEWIKPSGTINKARFFQFRIRQYKPERTFKHYITTVNFKTKHSLR